MDKKYLIEENTTIKKMANLEEIAWINKKEKDYLEYEKALPISDEELKEAEKRLNRFAPFIKKGISRNNRHKWNY